MPVVLGRDVRLPASLADDQEVMRVGAQALAATPNSIFYRKTQLRMAAREARAAFAPARTRCGRYGQRGPFCLACTFSITMLLTEIPHRIAGGELQESLEKKAAQPFGSRTAACFWR